MSTTHVHMYESKQGMKNKKTNENEKGTKINKVQQNLEDGEEEKA